MPWHTHTHAHAEKSVAHTHTHTEQAHAENTKTLLTQEAHAAKNTAQHTSYKNWSAYESSHFYTPMACR